LFSESDCVLLLGEGNWFCQRIEDKTKSNINKSDHNLMTDQWMSCRSSKMTKNLFSETDCVLLLGEGNFSFAEELSNCCECKIIATDLLIDYSNHPLVQKNIKHLRSFGHEVYLDIDATNLENCRQLKAREDINHIVFNFPHVLSKKMKIGLNRELLKKFFVSAHNYISDRRVKVHVTLCSGQSGIDEVETHHKRQWSDSWQLPEMASFGHFVIISVTPFDCNYQSFGYRLKNICFNTSNANTFSFEKRDHLIISSNKLTQILLNNNKNLFSNYLVNQLIDELRSVFINSLSIKCEVDLKATYFPFVKHWIVLEKQNDTLLKLKNYFNSFENFVIEREIIQINDTIIGFIYDSCLKLSVEQLANLKWNISDSRILWSKYLYFDEHNDDYRTGSLYYREHSHDISFWINQTFSYSNLLETVLDVFGTLLKSIRLIDTYEVDSRTSKCYRMVYQSVDCALSQQKCNKMQELLRNVLNEKLNFILR
jgi:hypothetical protein